MVRNDLTPENIVEKGKDLAFPDSVVSYFEGMMGQPVGGFPDGLQKIVLKGKEPITCRPGELLPPVDFEATGKQIARKHGITPDMRDILSYSLYPNVIDDYIVFKKNYGDLSRMESPLFFYGLKRGVPAEVEVEEGRIFIIQLVSMGKVDSEGYRQVVFEVDGYRRVMNILDKQYRSEKVVSATTMASPDNPGEIGASIPGTVSKILVKEGETFTPDKSLIIIEAMKMETSIKPQGNGRVKEILVKEGQAVKAGELLMRIDLE